MESESLGVGTLRLFHVPCPGMRINDDEIIQPQKPESMNGTNSALIAETLRHFVVITLTGVPWAGKRRKVGKVRSVFCIFHLTTSRTCDSLLSWSFCGHIVVGRLWNVRKSAMVPALGKMGVGKKQKIVRTKPVSY